MKENNDNEIRIEENNPKPKVKEPVDKNPSFKNKLKDVNASMEDPNKDDQADKLSAEQEKKITRDYTKDKHEKERKLNEARQTVEVDGEKWIKTEEKLDSYKVQENAEVPLADQEFDTIYNDIEGEMDVYNEHLSGQPYKRPYYPEDENIIYDENEDEGPDYVEDLYREEDDTYEYVLLNETKEVKDAIEKAKEEARNKVEAEHAALKKRFDEATKLRAEVQNITELVTRYQTRINELNLILEDKAYPDSQKVGIKDSIKGFNTLLEEQFKKKMSIGNKKEADALNTINEYEAALKTYDARIKAAEKAAEEKARSEALAKQIEDKYIKSENKKYRDYRYQRLKNADEKKYVDDYDSKEKDAFNNELRSAIKDFENAPKEDLYKLNILKKRNGDFIQLKKFSEMELLNAEQVFDRMFRRLNNFYDNHHFKIAQDYGTSLLNNIYLMDKEGSANSKEIKTVKKPLSDIIDKMMQFEGIKQNETESETYNRYAKAFVLQVMQDNYRDLIFQPHYFDINGKFNRADLKDETYSIRLNDADGLITDPDRIKELSKEPYQRLSFNKMIRDDYDNKAPEQPKNNIIDINEVEEEIDPELKDSINKLKMGLDGIAEEFEDVPDFKAEGIVEFNAKRARAEEEKNRAQDQNVINEDAQNILNQDDKYTEIDLGDDEEEYADLVAKDRDEEKAQEEAAEAKEANDDNFSVAPKIDDERLQEVEKDALLTDEEIKQRQLEEERQREEEEKLKIEQLRKRIADKEKERIKPIDKETAEIPFTDYLKEEYYDPNKPEQAHAGIKFVKNEATKYKNALDEKYDNQGWDANQMYKPMSYLYASEENFPEFKDEIRSIVYPITANETFIASNKHGITNTPEPYNSTRRIITDPDLKLKMAMDKVKFNKVYDALVFFEQSKATADAKKQLTDFEKTLDKNDPDYNKKVKEFKEKHDYSRQPNVRVLEVMQKHEALYNSPYFENIYQKFNSEFNVVEAAMLNFPANAFYAGENEKHEKIFKADDERYFKMMERLPFLDVIEDSQNFLVNYALPYEKSKALGTLSEKEIRKFEKAYKDHVNKQKEYFKILKEVKSDDPDVSQLRAFSNGFNQKYVKNWLGQRLAGAAEAVGEEKLDIIDRGWPVEDCALISELSRIEKYLKDSTKNEKITKEKQDEAAKILAEMAPAMKALKNNYVINPEMRDDLLEKFVSPINKFVAWDNTMPRKLNNVETYLGHPVKNLFEEAMKRKVYASEMGQGELRIVDAKKGVLNVQNAGNNLAEETVKVPAAISDDMLIKNVDSMVDDLHAVEVRILGSGQFKDMKNSLEALQKYSKNMFITRADITGNAQAKYLESLNQFKNMAISAREDVQRYLEHKQEDFVTDRTRRDSRGKQGTEQSRIKMAINNYDKLSFIIDRIQEYQDSMNPTKQFERNELPKLVNDTKKKLDNKIEQELNNINTLKQDKQQFVLSVCKIAMTYILKNAHSRYVLNGDETPEHFRQRMTDIQNKDYSIPELNKLAKNNTVLNNIIRHYGKFYDDGMKAEGDKFDKPTLDDIGFYCRGAIQASSKEMKRESSQEKSKNYKEKLISEQNKTARRQREERKAESRARKNKDAHQPGL